MRLSVYGLEKYLGSGYAMVRTAVDLQLFELTFKMSLGPPQDMSLRAKQSPWYNCRQRWRLLRRGVHPEPVEGLLAMTPLNGYVDLAKLAQMRERLTLNPSPSAEGES